MNDKEKIEVDGFKFTVEVAEDDDSEAPWKRCDGHGPVRAANSIHDAKRPGERPMSTGRYRRYPYFYDWQAACKMARKDKWGPGGIQEAVQADFDYLQGWLNQDWYYVLVTVTLDMYPAYTATLGGVETFKDYHEEMKQEMAQELIREYFRDLENMTIKGVELCSET